MIPNFRSLTPGLRATVTIAQGAHTTTAGTGGTSITPVDSEAIAFMVAVGAWTDGTHTIKFQKSDGAGGWTDLTAAELDAASGVLTGAAIVISSAAKDGKVYFVSTTTPPGLAVRAHFTVATGATGATYTAAVLESSLRYTGVNPMSDSSWRTEVVP